MFKISARASPLVELELGNPWNASPASTTTVVWSFLARSFSITVANFASPTTDVILSRPFSSTIRPWTSLVWTNTKFFSADAFGTEVVELVDSGAVDCACVVVADDGVVVVSSEFAKAAPPEVAIANPTIVADAKV